jgi:S-methylmethionine-dependent homocysteine/selenocysteine methylase
VILLAKYRDNLPQLSENIFLTDGGLETTMMFKEGFELPAFAAFDLLKNEKGRTALKNYYRKYASLARERETGFILESATWRANPDWGAKLGYTNDALKIMNHLAIELLSEIRAEFEDKNTIIVISGCIGPRSDGYNPVNQMTAVEAEAYHSIQVQALSETDTDLVSAFTINYVEEAIGIARAAQKLDMPVVISFTVETDGKLPTGLTLKDAIQNVDTATKNYPSYYMINCAHPNHFKSSLVNCEPWTLRIRGIRANASQKSHAELDEAEELDPGNPNELGKQYNDLRYLLKNLTILGGCCGTDYQHVEKIYDSFLF